MKIPKRKIVVTPFTADKKPKYPVGTKNGIWTYCKAGKDIKVGFVKQGDIDA